MAKRKIIKIDEDKCNGCGLCIPNCPEGALQVIDGKARLISDLFCDGLGACIGHCPEGAINIEEREAEAYDEGLVMENIIKQGPNVIKAHLEHLRDHGETDLLKEAVNVLTKKALKNPLEEKSGKNEKTFQGCPGMKMMDFGKKGPGEDTKQGSLILDSELRQWPVQLMLVPPNAPYFKGADILITADCVPFAYANFHSELLKGKRLLVGCPKLDDLNVYKAKLKSIITDNDIKGITYAHMEVPCCFGLIGIIESAIKESGKNVPFKALKVTIKGQIEK